MSEEALDRACCSFSSLQLAQALLLLGNVMSTAVGDASAGRCERSIALRRPVVRWGDGRRPLSAMHDLDGTMPGTRARCSIHQAQSCLATQVVISFICAQVVWYKSFVSVASLPTYAFNPNPRCTLSSKLLCIKQRISSRFFLDLLQQVSIGLLHLDFQALSLVIVPRELITRPYLQNVLQEPHKS